MFLFLSLALVIVATAQTSGGDIGIRAKQVEITNAAGTQADSQQQGFSHHCSSKRRSLSCN